MLKRKPRKSKGIRSRALLLVIGLDYFWAAVVVAAIVIGFGFNRNLYSAPNDLAPLPKMVVNVIPLLGELLQVAGFNLFLPIIIGICLIFLGLGLSLWQQQWWAYWLNLAVYVFGAYYFFTAPILNRPDFDVSFVVCAIAAGLLMVNGVFSRYEFRYANNSWLVMIPVGVGAALLAANSLTHVEFLPSYIKEFSPDGKELTLMVGSDLHVMNSDGTHDRVLVSGISYSSLGLTTDSWSPDGTHIAYIGADQEIHVVNADGSNDYIIYNEYVNWCGGTIPARWSPDGKQIVFTEPDMYNTNILVINANGTEQHIITKTIKGCVGSALDWSPDGRMILYNDDSGLRIIRPDGTGDQLIISADPNSHACMHQNDPFQPTWSSDSQQVLQLTTLCEGGAEVYELQAVKTNGTISGTNINLSTSPTTIRWSTDRQQVFFMSYVRDSTLRDSTINIFMTTVSGSDSHIVAKGVDPLFFALSHDGKEIAYARAKMVCVSAIDGTNEHCFPKHRR